MIVLRHLAMLICVVSSLGAADLRPEATASFDRYVKLTEDAFAKRQAAGDFLWLDSHSAEKSLVWLGESATSSMLTEGPEMEVPDAVIEHWLGAVYLEGATLDRVRDVIMNFNDYKNFFKQQVIDSKLNKQDGNQFDALLRFYKKRFSAVVLNVHVIANYTPVDNSRLYVPCRSTHIGEVEHPKNKKEYDQERSPDDAAGYLWRLNLYWRLQQADNGVYVELELISLARKPTGMIKPSQLLNGFQDFPHELTKGMIDSLQAIFPHHR